jgi:hypothetical protein
MAGQHLLKLRLKILSMMYRYNEEGIAYRIFLYTCVRIIQLHTKGRGGGVINSLEILQTY